MANIAGVVITKVLQRVRDPQGSAHTRTFVLKILSHAQRVVNAIFGEVKITDTFNTEADRIAYPVRPTLDKTLRVVSVTQDGSELATETLEGLRGFDPSWPRTRADKMLAFAPVGRDLLFLYPALPRTSSVQITSIKDTGIIVGEASELEIPDNRAKIALDFTEVVLLLRQRDLDEAEALLKELTERIQKRQV